MVQRQASDLDFAVRVPVQVQIFLLTFDNELKNVGFFSALLVKVSVCLTTNHEVADSIPGTFKILNGDQVWNGVHPAS